MSGHIVTKGLGGMTMITRGYGVSAFTAIIFREVLRLYSYIKTTIGLESNIHERKI